VIVATQLGDHRVCTRDEAAIVLDSETTERLLKKTGPEYVYRCGPNEDALDLSVRAFEKLKMSFDLNYNHIRNLIYVTENSRCRYPGNGFLFATASNLHNELFILDVNAGCTGFVDALLIAFGLNVPSLIVCAESYSKNIQTYNRTVSPIFSDGAAAIFFDPSEWRLHFHRSVCQSSSWEAISCPYGGDLKMNGATVFEFVNNVVVALTQEALNVVDADYLLLHQGSKLVVEHLTKRFKRDGLDIPYNISYTGNLVSATLPKLYDDFFDGGRKLNRGSKIVLSGFGVGLSATVVAIEKL
jgi:3-oxoacyl-[acyl-carrier-protein] synthase-3